jgi:hypothetical protein
VKLTKIETKKLFKSCINLVTKKPASFFVLKRLKNGIFGYCYYDENRIEIDPRNQFLETAIHECIHFLNPSWSETDVLYAEKRILNNCSYKDLMLFTNTLSSKLYMKEKFKNKKEIF